MANKKYIILPITVTVTLALALALALSLSRALVNGQNPKPCMQGKDKDFKQKHILREDLKVDKARWSIYLKDKGLCGRTGKLPQSFIYNTMENVRKICHKDCRNPEDNLCVSPHTMTVYDVVSTWNGKVCTVTGVTCWIRQVVLACDKFGDGCQPVHYQAKSKAKVINKPC